MFFHCLWMKESKQLLPTQTRELPLKPCNQHSQPNCGTLVTPSGRFCVKPGTNSSKHFLTYWQWEQITVQVGEELNINMKSYNTPLHFIVCY